ncbi:ABC transporter permease [Brockia lithotrophica]|uniref:Oligopeptide transport system permease protein n=1 Tax=Brockia lithotrophica TaxID=933949 RepID=A0A660LAZ1_9BACL|nr:ABC transporter permease [Brockia lithotrophica]RKQ89123.1 oligopeptide transport system permease protein [Brockia lithotrophica]
MLAYTFRRFMSMLFTLFIIATLTFFLVHALPGGPYKNPEKLTPEIKQLFDRKYGLDKPVAVQYVMYLENLLQGNLGYSFKYENQTVDEIIARSFPVSAQIGLQALLVGLPVGLLFGVLAALNRARALDYGLVFLAVLGVSIPSFVLAGFLQYIFGVKLRVLPVALWGGFEYSILPTLSLAVGVVALVTRLMRTSMLDVLGADFLRTAVAKGLSRRTVIWRHALRNALLPIVTIFGVLVVDLITGSIIIEQIFSVPGIGQHYVTSINNNDYTLVMGLTIFYSLLFVLAIFFTDIAYGLVDPRIRIAGRKE